MAGALEPKEAGKLENFLMNPKSRPDLQTPEGQAWLRLLQHHHEQIGDKFDPLTPWLTREWKKGRLGHEYDPSRPPGYMYLPLGHSLNPRILSHWADFLQSNHPLRRELGDIMGHQVDAFGARVQAWDEAMEAEAHEQALQGGRVVHTTPDNWTVRQLTSPEELKAEGDAMGHCVGGYGDAVDRGHSLIYSLRDPQGVPHITTEIQPTQYRQREPDWLWAWSQNEPLDSVDAALRKQPEVMKGLFEYEAEKRMFEAGTHHKYTPEALKWQGLFNELEHKWDQHLAKFGRPEQGRVVQIQGTANQDPKPEYKARMKNWFETFPTEDRPVSGDTITSMSELNPEHPHFDQYESVVGPDEYGIRANIDYPSVVRSLDRRSNGYYRGPDYEPDEIEQLYNLARAQGEIPDLAEGATEYQDKDVNNSWDQLIDYNQEYLGSYPGQEWEEDPDHWAEVAEAEGYESPAAAHEHALNGYYQNESDLQSNHVPSQIANGLWDKLTPHFHPEGWAMTEEGPKSSGYYNPVYRSEFRQFGPGEWENYLATWPSPQPEPPQGTFSKVAAGAPDPHDLRTFPVGQYDQALQEALNNPTRLQYTYRPDLDKEDWGGYKRYHYDVTPIGAPAMHEAVKYDRLRRFGYDPELVDPDDEGEAAQFRTQWRWKGHPEWRQEMYRDPETGAAGGFNEEVHGRPDHLYRGMSHEEFEQAKGRGYFDSDRSYNLGEEGTLFSTDPSQARSYATGFSPWHRNPGFNAPGYVIEVPRPQDAFPHPSQSPDTTEIVAPSQVPFNQATRAWQFRPYATLAEDMNMRTENYGQTWTGKPYYDNYYAYRPYPLGRATTAADLNPNIRKCPYCKGEGSVDAPQLLPEMPFLNMGTGEQGQGVWFDGARDICPECHGMRYTGLGRDHPPPLAQTDEHMNQWGGFSQDYNVDPKSLPPLGTPKQGGATQPLYKRWAFSPVTGQVELSDNTGDPIDVRYHGDLAREINEPNLVHGYAYRIGNGWRLTDWDSKPLSDPYIVAQVMRRLQADQSGSAAVDGSWEDDGEDDWTRIHHGLPT